MSGFHRILICTTRWTTTRVPGPSLRRCSCSTAMPRAARPGTVGCRCSRATIAWFAPTCAAVAPRPRCRAITPGPRPHRRRLRRSLDALGVERCHLVSAKIGGTIARAFAARRPERVRTLTVVGSPTPLRVGADANIPERLAELEQHGVEHWARRTMSGRLGSTFPPEGVEWWIQFMGRTALSSQLGFVPFIASADIPGRRPEDRLSDTGHHHRGQRPRQRRRHARLAGDHPDSELLVLPGDSYHVAASDAARCAQATLDFIQRGAPAPENLGSGRARHRQVWRDVSGCTGGRRPRASEGQVLHLGKGNQVGNGQHREPPDGNVAPQLTEGPGRWFTISSHDATCDARKPHIILRLPKGEKHQVIVGCHGRGRQTF